MVNETKVLGSSLEERQVGIGRRKRDARRAGTLRIISPHTDSDFETLLLGS